MSWWLFKDGQPTSLLPLTAANPSLSREGLAAVKDPLNVGWPSLKSPQRATIVHVGTVLIFLVVAVVVASVVFLLASLVFGRGEELAALVPEATPPWLPDGPIIGDDIRAVRFAQVLRGYRMSEVDWTLERAAAELDALRARVAELEAQR